MTGLQVEYFLNVADHMSFSKTAAAMQVSQAAVSRQIASLEDELGVRLFARKYRRLTLTEAGAIMCDLFSRQRQDYQDALKKAKAQQDEARITLTIGLLDGLDLDELCLSLKEKAAEDPQLTLNFQTEDAASLEEGVQSGRLDAALSVLLEEGNACALLDEPVLPLRRQVILSAAHPLAGKKNLSWKDLAKETFAVVIPDTPEAKEDFRRRAFRTLGFMPEEVRCVRSESALLSEVRCNGCAALIFDRTPVAEKDRYHILPADSFAYVSLLRSKTGRSSHAERLFAALRQPISSDNKLRHTGKQI